jgi:hypothetical protein
MRARLTITAALAALGSALAVSAPAWADNEFGIPGGGEYPSPAPAAAPAPPPAPAGEPAPADPGAAPTPAPVMHHVRYTVTADEPFYSRIYYRQVDPPTWSDYSHDPYQFSPRADADIGPGQPWVFDTSLVDPALWAMVVVQSGEGPNFPTPAFHCTLEVDGSVVSTNSGPHGALCSLRKW